MPLSFPTTPTTGDTYSYSGKTWTWTGTLWQAVNTPMGPTGPTGPIGVTGPTGAAGANTTVNVTGPITNSGTTTAAVIGVDNTVTITTGVQTLINKTLTAPVLNSPVEIWTTTATAATGTVQYDCATQGVLYYITAASANWTLNFRGTSSISLNSLLAAGQTITINFLNTNGGTAYYPTAFTIDGTSVTPKWSGGNAPSAGNTSSVDAYSFTISKTGANTYNVFAAGPIKYA